MLLLYEEEMTTVWKEFFNNPKEKPQQVFKITESI